MLTATLLAMAGIALLLSALEVLALRRHLARPASRPAGNGPTVSILKPLCGVDSDLEENLASFLDQAHADYEVLLGVASREDPAYALAQSLARRHPGRVRLVVQEAAVGLNPKVNQLATLARRARGEVLVISDSNVRVPREYLGDLVAPLDDAEVGIVTSPIAAAPGARLGGRLDALHLQTFVTPAIAGARSLAGQELFVGKSMAMRRRDVERLGGFAAFADLLAEDHALGRAMLGMGMRAAFARVPIVNVTDLGTKGFFDRVARWGLMQRCVAGAAYPAQILNFPIVLAWLALPTDPRPEILAAVVAATLAKMALDSCALRALSGHPPALSTLTLSPLREALALAALAKAAFSNRVCWRGKWFVVTEGTRLLPVEEHAEPSPADPPELVEST